jgi:fructose-specific phosphotransferase system IIC component
MIELIIIASYLLAGAYATYIFRKRNPDSLNVNHPIVVYALLSLGWLGLIMILLTNPKSK